MRESTTNPRKSKSTNAINTAWNPKKNIVYDPLKSSWTKKNRTHPSACFAGCFFVHTIASAAAIMPYKTSQTKMNVESEGVRAGFVRLAYQLETCASTKRYPMNPAPYEAMTATATRTNGLIYPQHMPMCRRRQ